MFLAIIFTSVSSNAYRWIFSNFSDDTLIIKVKLFGSSNNYFNLVKPDKTVDFEWGLGNPRVGYCLSEIEFTPVTNKLLYSLQFSKIIDDRGDVIDNDKMASFLKIYAEHLRVTNPDALNKDNDSMLFPGVIKFETDPLFQQTLKSGSKVGTKLIKWLGEAISESKCRSRDYGIVKEDNGKFYFFTKAN